jgi:hypothetical protein
MGHEMPYLQDIFAGWSMSEVANVSEEIFDCAMTFIAVCLSGSVTLNRLCQPHTSYSLYAGHDVVEVLTKCRVQHLLRGKDPFVAAG